MSTRFPHVRSTMLPDLTLNEINSIGTRMIAILGLTSSPVSVRVLPPDAAYPEGAKHLVQHRYCQAVMKAGHGREVVLEAEGISCPAAAAAFGFRPWPAQLRCGKGLVGFGIVSDPAVGKRIFDDMPKLEAGSVGACISYRSRRLRRRAW